MADELALITEAGDNLATRLEQRLTGAAQSQRDKSKKTGQSLKDLNVAADDDDDRNEVLEALKRAR